MPPRRLLRTTLCLALATPVAACSSDPTSNALPDAGVTCVAPTGPGTQHATSPATDETWSAADSPHVITTSLAIPAGRTLTIAPCAVVQLQFSVGVTVEGTLIAEGTAATPIRFEGAATDAWGAIETRAGAVVRLAHVTVDGGGGGREATLDIRGDQDAAPQPILRVDHVTVRGASAGGVQVREGGGFAPGSTDLTITGAAWVPLAIWGRAAGGIPTGTYSGNGTDAIFLTALGGRDDIQEDTTLADHGVPYRVGGNGGGLLFRVRGASAPVLTIAAGATLQFADGARLLVDATTSGMGGALVVAGTAAAPVTFTSASATPVAGRWVGLVFLGAQDPHNAITHARIAYAGGESQISSYDCPSPLNTGFANNGAVVIAGGQPAGAFITSTIIEASWGDGIVRGWTGAVIDLLPTNTFTSVARCHQTYPRPASGSCPDPAPCPQ